MKSDVTNPRPNKPKPRCEICNGCFGLIRHRFAHKQFCSNRCLDRYLANRKQQPSSSVDRFLSQLSLFEYFSWNGRKCA
jgi:hypothetical protein